MRITCQVRPSIISERLDGEVIVLDVESGAYYVLTEGGSVAWNRFVDVESADVDPTDSALGVLSCFVAEGFVTCDIDLGPAADPSSAFTKHVDLADLLLADPIHEVDPSGWPSLRSKDD